MERHLKIFLMALIGLVFPCLSFAYPDLYYYNNYLTGQSPYYYTGSADGSALYYYPNVGAENTKEGFVTCFSDQHMSGTVIPSAIPLVDLDYTPGRVFELKPNHAMVVTSKSASYLRLYYSGDFYGTLLGTSRVSASNVPGTYTNYNIVMDTNGYVNSSPYNFLSSSDAFYLGFTHYTGSNSIFMVGQASSVPANFSNIYLLMNFSATSSYFTVSQTLDLTTSPNVTYNAESIDMLEDINFLLTSVRTADGMRMFCLPHIKGEIDIYSPYYNREEKRTSYTIYTQYNVTLSLSLSSEGNVVCGIDGYTSSCHSESLLNIAFVEPTLQRPFFLNAYDSIKDYSTAVYVKDGYINISNYDELVAKLKESGIGSSDLSRITQLLEEINSGGATGAAVKELIGILENYHQQLINSADFGSITNIFDTYKNLLDFSDDMHWLITANNALFSYFAGFIMLCTMFLILNRIMR